MKKFLVATASKLIVGLTFLMLFKLNMASGLGEDKSLVAHAGGRYRGEIYTNSLDALNANSSFYSLFELDFSLTSDGHVVCMKDWSHSAKRTFGKEFAIPPTYVEFLELVGSNKRYKNCTLDSLELWLVKNPGKDIISDAKYNNIDILSEISRNKFLRNRFIPQIYSIEEYHAVKKMGFNRTIFTLYKSNISNEEVAYFAKNNDQIFAITMPESRALSLIPILKKEKINTYIHTVNTYLEYNKYINMGASGIYTDDIKKAIIEKN